MSWLHREININQRIAQINAHNLLLLNHLTRLGEITSLWKDFTNVWENVWGLIEHLEKIWTCISNFFAFGDTFIVLIGQILKKINYPSCHQRKPLYHIRVWWIPRWLIRLLRRRPYFFIAFSEMIVIGYIYGIESFFADLNHMVSFNPGVWSKVHFSVIYLTVAPCSICVSWRVFYNIIFATSAIGSRSRRWGMVSAHCVNWIVYLR